jgi:hypothetical protein
VFHKTCLNLISKAQPAKEFNVYIRAMKAILILFELVSGLKVNLYKSMLVGVNVNEWLIDAAVVVNCKICRIPFVYLRPSRFVVTFNG